MHSQVAMSTTAGILEAEGEALAIRLVNESADRYFTGNAQLLRRLITVERSLQNNSKIVVPAGSELVNVIGDIAGGLPLPARIARVASRVPAEHVVQ
jgi:hypothetical protein